MLLLVAPEDSLRTRLVEQRCGAGDGPTTQYWRLVGQGPTLAWHYMSAGEAVAGGGDHLSRCGPAGWLMFIVYQVMAGWNPLP